MESIAEMFSLGGRTALVTGASRGLGRTFAHTLAEAGASVMISATNAEALAQVKQDFSKAGISVKTHAAELRDRRQIEKLAKAAQTEFGYIDILVANAGISGTAPVESFSPENMDELLEINLLAPMLLTRLLVPGMKEKKWGRLIYLSSVAAFVSSASDGHAIYSATKAGLNGFMRTAAIELGAFGITANSIAPGTFLTDMAQRVLDTHGDEGRASYDKYAKMNALHRWGNVRELMGPLLLLASDAGSFVTGTVLMVDGGFTVRSTPAQ